MVDLKAKGWVAVGVGKGRKEKLNRRRRERRRGNDDSDEEESSESYDSEVDEDEEAGEGNEFGNAIQGHRVNIGFQDEVSKWLLVLMGGGNFFLTAVEL